MVKSAKKTKQKNPQKKQKKQQIEKLLTISVVFPSCDQIQPMDGLFYTKDEVAPYCSPEDRSCFFLLKILFDLHGRTSSYFVVCLNYLPLVFYILQKKKKKFVLFCFVYFFIVEACTCCFQQFQHEEFWIPTDRENGFKFHELFWFFASSLEQ